MSLLRAFIVRDELVKRGLFAFVESNWLALARQDRPLYVTISEFKAKRSLPQNSFYWALLSEISDNAWITGKQYDREAWHHFYADLFLPKREVPGGILYPVSTTTLDVAEFGQYLDKIQAHATSELGVQFGVAA